MDEKIAAQSLFALTGISEEDIRNEAENRKIKLSDKKMYLIANALFSDLELSTARHEAIGRVLEWCG